MFFDLVLPQGLHQCLLQLTNSLSFDKVIFFFLFSLLSFLFQYDGSKVAGQGGAMKRYSAQCKVEFVQNLNGQCTG